MDIKYSKLLIIITNILSDIQSYFKSCTYDDRNTIFNICNELRLLSNSTFYTEYVSSNQMMCKALTILQYSSL